MHLEEKKNMEPNNTQYRSFLWHLEFEPFTWHTFYDEQCPPFVTEDNKEAWRRYLTKVIKKQLKAEVMNTPEFREIETMVTLRFCYDYWSDGIRNPSHRYWRRTDTMQRMPSLWRCASIYHCSLPETPFEGEPMAVTREPNDMEKALL